MLLNIPRAGNINAFWLAEKILEKGALSFGEATMQRSETSRSK